MRTIRLARNDDLTGITALARDVYQDDKLTENFVKWKYRGNPFGAILAVCEQDGQIIGSSGLVARPMKIGPSTERCAIGGDSMVHPRFQRQGIFVDMCRYLDDKAASKISMTYGTQSVRSPTVRGLTKYHRTKIAGDITILKKCLVSLAGLVRLLAYSLGTPALLGRHLSTLAESTFLSISASLDELRNPFQRRRYKGPDRGHIEIKEINPLVFDDEFDQLWESARDSFSVTGVRIKEYLNWRYSNPEGSYVGFRAEEEGMLGGYSVLAYTHQGRLKIGWVLDLFTATPQAADALLEHVMERARHDKAHVLTMFANKQTSNLTKRLGFRRALQNTSLNVTVSSPEIREDLLNDISNWHLTVADTNDDI